MQPENFFLAPERTEWDDQHYAAIGRGLAIASRLEGLCQSIAMGTGIQANPDVLSSESNLTDFSTSMRRRPLARHMQAVCELIGKDVNLTNVLREAREARNEIAHELSLGFEHWQQASDSYDLVASDLRRCASKLAAADLIVSLLATYLNGKSIPSAEYLRGYEGMIVNWICEL